MSFARRLLPSLLLGLLACAPLRVNALEKISRPTYLGAIVTDANSGAVLFADNADAHAYPASVTKLMTFAVVMDRIIAGQLKLDTPVNVTAEAARTGGSQVYLKEGEVFTVDELLKALMISSANDAAVALALHVAGSKEAFVALMNEKARALGLSGTTFHSPHGLPPSRGQEPDVSTARDLATLARELIRQDHVLDYSSIKVSKLRENTANPFEMRNHNHLLGKLAGCDGLKTGYFSAGGFSLAATAERNGQRVIAVVLGSETSKARDLKTMELIESGLAKLATAPVATISTQTPATPATVAQPARTRPTQDTNLTAVPVIKTSPAPAAASSSTSSTEPVVVFRVIPPANSKK